MNMGQKLKEQICPHVFFFRSKCPWTSRKLHICDRKFWALKYSVGVDNKLIYQNFVHKKKRIKNKEKKNLPSWSQFLKVLWIVHTMKIFLPEGLFTLSRFHHGIGWFKHYRCCYSKCEIQLILLPGEKNKQKIHSNKMKTDQHLEHKITMHAKTGKCWVFFIKKSFVPKLWQSAGHFFLF